MQLVSQAGGVQDFSDPHLWLRVLAAYARHLRAAGWISQNQVLGPFAHHEHPLLAPLQLRQFQLRLPKLQRKL
jgi:hypothetical protein